MILSLSCLVTLQRHPQDMNKSVGNIRFIRNRYSTLIHMIKPMGEVVKRTHLDLFGEEWLCSAVCPPRTAKVCSK